MRSYIYGVILFITCFTFINCQCYCDNAYQNGDGDFENNHLICDISRSDEVITINTFKNNLQSHCPSNPFASACVKCLLCTTIAELIQKAFMSLHTEYPPKHLLNAAKLNSKMRYFCDNGFKNFDLQEERGLRFLSKLTKYSVHVPSEIDGKWPLKLKEMCHEFLDSTGEEDLYIRWFYATRDINFEITDMLCRSHGIFQHCRNLHYLAKKPFEISCYT